MKPVRFNIKIKLIKIKKASKKFEAFLFYAVAIIIGSSWMLKCSVSPGLMWKAGIVFEWYPAASMSNVESPGMNGWRMAEPFKSPVLEMCSSGEETLGYDIIFFVMLSVTNALTVVISWWMGINFFEN